MLNQMTKRYRIMCRDTNGNVFEAFKWVFSPEGGINRARKEAPRFGHTLTNCWAEEIVQ